MKIFYLQFFLFVLISYLGYKWAFEDDNSVIISFWSLVTFSILLERYYAKKHKYFFSVLNFYFSRNNTPQTIMVVTKTIFIIKRIGFECHHWQIGGTDCTLVALKIVGITQSSNHIKTVVLVTDRMVFQ